jgi:hypothetical protein
MSARRSPGYGVARRRLVTAGYVRSGAPRIRVRLPRDQIVPTSLPAFVLGCVLILARRPDGPRPVPDQTYQGCQVWEGGLPDAPAWLAGSERVGASAARPGNSVPEHWTRPGRAVRRRFRCRRPYLTSLAPVGVPIADRLGEFAGYFWPRFAGLASLIAFVRNRVQCYWVASVIVPPRQAGESEMALMQIVSLGLRQPWFASKAQAPDRQDSHRSTRYAVPALLARRYGKPPSRVKCSRSRSHTRCSGSPHFAGSLVVDTAPSS